MTWAVSKWTAAAVIAVGAVGAFAIYTLGWRNAEADGDRLERTAQAERAEAISVVRLRAKAACEAPWWEDDYCLSRVKATRFTAEKVWDGVWQVREHIRGDQRFQDICWLVEPARLSRPIDVSLGWTFTGLSPARCVCPRNGALSPSATPDGRDFKSRPGEQRQVRC